MLARWVFRLVGGSFLGLMALPVQAGERKEFTLKYRLSTNITAEVGPCGQYLQPATTKIALKEEPKYQSRQPLYASVRLGAKKDPFTLVLDNSKGEALGYDILYVDANRDGKITSEEKLIGAPKNQGMVFGPIKLVIDCGKEKCPQWFLFILSEYEVQTVNLGSQNGGGKANGRIEVQRHLMVINAGYYQGEVTFGDQKRLLAVVDADGNGLYNDFSKGTNWDGDRLVIDLDGDGKLDGSYQSEKAQPLCRYVQAGDRFWQLDVAPDGSSVTVELLNKPLGTLQVGHADLHLLLSGDEGVLRVRSKDGTVRLPAGKYRLLQCNYRLTDKNGRCWQFFLQADDGQGKSVEVHTAKAVTMPVGPPLVPKVKVTSEPGNELILNLELRGACGEHVSNVQVGNQERPPAPKAKIIDSAGRELAMLDFHYG